MSSDLIIAIVSSIATGLISWGITHEKVARLEDDVKALREERESFVTFKHFDAVIQPLRTTMNDVQLDLKVLLKIVGRFSDQ